MLGRPEVHTTKYLERLKNGGRQKTKLRPAGRVRVIIKPIDDGDTPALSPARPAVHTRRRRPHRHTSDSVRDPSTQASWSRCTFSILPSPVRHYGRVAFIVDLILAFSVQACTVLPVCLVRTDTRGNCSALCRGRSLCGPSSSVTHTTTGQPHIRVASPGRNPASRQGFNGCRCFGGGGRAWRERLVMRIGYGRLDRRSERLFDFCPCHTHAVPCWRAP